MSTPIDNARLAEQAERFEDMKKFMTDYVAGLNDKSATLTTEERNLLSVAFKNVVGQRRTALNILISIHEKEKGERKKEACKKYSVKVKAELEKECKLVSDLLKKLCQVSSSSEEKVFYYKMKGDYNRYLAEAESMMPAEGEAKADSNDPKKESETAYEEALKEASNLDPTHPTRLGLALNLSVFYYEIQNQPDKACQCAKTAFELAIAKLDQLPEESYRDCTLIMQLLRDNLTLWTSDEVAQQQEDD